VDMFGMAGAGVSTITAGVTDVGGPQTTANQCWFAANNRLGSRITRARLLFE
jgi:hypothetical protein